MKYVVVTTGNEYRIVEGEYEEQLGLLQPLVGGHIEVVHPARLPRKFLMIVNEEGLLHGLPVNPTGSLLYGTHIHGQPIVGDVVFTTEGWVQGDRDIIGMSDEMVDTLVTSYLLSLNPDLHFQEEAT